MPVASVPLLHRLLRFIDSDHFVGDPEVIRNQPERMEWGRLIPFIILHMGCLGIIWVGWSWVAVATAVFLYFARMFLITGFYHRYFSHKTFQTSRAAQFIFAFLGITATQRGPLWWAWVHRHHHKHSDEEDDFHSPGVQGFLWAHIGWITSSCNFPTDYSKIKDLAKYPELVFLNRFDLIGPIVLAAAMLGWGWILQANVPAWGTSPGQMLIWGFFISTTFLFHGTACINSLAHVLGRRRYETRDDSRNSMILSLITLGEGWHNNHHRYQAATRQGFYWWEFDPTYYLLKTFSWLGIIWDLRPVPPSVYREAEDGSGQPAA
jgi:stearoyl-CoA desaturase (Delta-9 desaturase)